MAWPSSAFGPSAPVVPGWRSIAGNALPPTAQTGQRRGRFHPRAAKREATAREL